MSPEAILLGIGVIVGLASMAGIRFIKEDSIPLFLNLESKIRYHTNQLEYYTNERNILIESIPESDSELELNPENSDADDLDSESETESVETTDDSVETTPMNKTTEPAGWLW